MPQGSRGTSAGLGRTERGAGHVGSHGMFGSPGTFVGVEIALGVELARESLHVGASSCSGPCRPVSRFAHEVCRLPVRGSRLLSKASKSSRFTCPLSSSSAAPYPSQRPGLPLARSA